MASNLQWAAPRELSFDGNVSENYRRFHEHWSLFEKTELKDRSEEGKCSYFLLCIGEKAREVYHTFDLPPETETEDREMTWKRSVQQLHTAFQQYCNPRKNITYERHKFFTRIQEQTETIDQYTTILRTLAATCEFKDLRDGLIRDRIICDISSQALRERLLRESDLTLQKALDICRASEHSKQQIKNMTDANKANIDVVRRGNNDTRRTPNPKPDTTRMSKRNQANDQRKACGNCGSFHRPRSCPAYGKQCDNCSRFGHFAKYCRSTQRQHNHNSYPRVHNVNYETCESEDEYDHGIDHLTIHSVNELHNKSSEHYSAITIGNTKLQIKLDTGAETSVLTSEDFNTIPVLGQC